MSRKSGKTKKTQPFSHIASAIIPSVGIIAIPAAATYFPVQKRSASEQWGSIAPTLLRAASASQLLVPSTITDLSHDERDRISRSTTQRGRMQASSDEEESIDTEDERRTQQKLHAARRGQSVGPQSAALSNAERRLLSHDDDDDEEPSSLLRGTHTATPRDPKEALTAELSRSTMKNGEGSPRKVSVPVGRQASPRSYEPVPSGAAPTSARITPRFDDRGADGKSITTARSSMNESTTIPMSARSVSFNDRIETYEPPSSQSQPTTAVHLQRENSVLEKLVLPPPEEYQPNHDELERRNQSLTVEVRQLRSNNRNLQNRYEELLDRLQNSQNLTKQELADILKQSGLDQTRDLEGLNNTLKERCNHLEDELIELRKNYAQSQNQPNVRELKNENNFLKDYVHRLNSGMSDYQELYPPASTAKETAKEQRRTQGLPGKGPPPIWLLNRKFLAPLFLCYDEKIRDREEFIRKMQGELQELQDQMKSIIDENLLLHQRLSRAPTSLITDGLAAIPSDLDNIKRQAYLVLEENRVLQEQLDLHKNQLADLQKTQIQEVSNLTRRLLIAESEKTEADRALETYRLRNDDLRRKYEQIMLDNNHRIHVQEHVYEISEMKRMTDELSEKHAHEMRSVLRRVQDSEAEKKVAQLKLTDCRSDLERLKGDLKATKKANQKLMLRVQTFEKKLELQQIKEQRVTAMVDQSAEEFEQVKQERDTYFTLAKKKEEELKEISQRMAEDAEKINRLEEGLQNLKNKSKDRLIEIHGHTRKEDENLTLRCLHYEQEIGLLKKLLNEKQDLVNDLSAEKRTLQVDLETIWQASSADNRRLREHLLGMSGSS